MVLEKIEKKEEVLNEVEKTSMFNQLVMGKDVTETIQTSRGDFKIKYPRMADLQAIGRLKAYRQSNIPAECFDEVSLSIMLQIATLDVLVISGPAWYENAKRENANFTWGLIPLQSFVQEVYAKAYEFRLKVQQHLENNGEGIYSDLASVGNVSDDGGPGLFDNINSNKLE